MAIMYNLFINFIFFSFYFFLKNRSKEFTPLLFIPPVVFNIVSNLYLFPEDNISFFFLLYWIMIFFLKLRWASEMPHGMEILLISPAAISLISHNYLYMNALIFLLIFTAVKYWSPYEHPRHVHFLFVLFSVAQFTSLNIEGRPMPSELIFGEVFATSSLNILALVIPLIIFMMTAMEESSTFVRGLLKLSFALCMMRMSEFIILEGLSLYLPYLFVFISFVVVMPLGRFDMTRYLFALSFSCMIGEEMSRFLPIYYLSCLLLGETINALVEEKIKYVQNFSGLLFLPFINPYATNIFSHLSELSFWIAFFFIIFYTSVLASVFSGRINR